MIRFSCTSYVLALRVAHASVCLAHVHTQHLSLSSSVTTCRFATARVDLVVALPSDLKHDGLNEASKAWRKVTFACT